MRHAKAAGDTTDLARPLTPRGRDDAGSMGRWLRARGWIPDAILASPAKRAQETAECVIEGMRRGPDVVTVEALYNNGPDVYRAVLEEAPHETTMIVGHDPAVTDLIHSMAPLAPLSPFGTLAPPGTVAVFDGHNLRSIHWPRHVAQE